MSDRDAVAREKSAGRGLRTALLAIIGGLYVFSVPWYRAPDAPLRLWLGLPDWVLTALVCYVAAAVLNAWAWWLTDVVDPPEPPHAGAPSALEREGRD